MNRASPRRVLLTNDDGPDSAFFKTWVPAIKEITGWETFVCLPAAPESFVSKAIAKGPIQVTQVQEGEVHVAGPPATCVNIALHNLGLEDVDLIISGPNVGHNAGWSSVMSSGTVGAAMEGALAGKMGIALSFPFFNGWENWTQEDIDSAIQVAGKVVTDLWWDWQQGVEVYNVNVPLGFKDEKGQRVEPKILRTTVDRASYSSLYRESETEPASYVWAPKGLRVFQTDDTELVQGGDVHAIKHGNVSVTPLYAHFEEHR
ncbi:probable 5'-nucleotidase SurE [Coccomyxa sp. Obi]|nr:probable 5'-nucleotidase SurE [Coccomyxa sp. Obi]